jgi:glycosyltransferase involved in cell wall biosynthesis
MEVLAAYTSYPLSEGDWRGRFVHDLTQALSILPDIHLRLWGPPGPCPANTHYVATPFDATWILRLLERGGIAHLLRRHPVAGIIAGIGLARRLRKLYRDQRDADVIHAYWLQTALPLMGTTVPLVASVLGTDMRLLSLPGMTSALRRVFRQRQSLLAPNAKWMVPILEKHFGDCTTVKYMPFGIADRWYAIQRKPVMKPRRWIVVLRITEKKIGPLFQWGRGIFNQDTELHLFGPRQEDVPIPDWVHYHGPADPADLVNEWYPSATGMITLSAHDEGRPQVLLEAMAAGLPVIVSPLEAHREIVQDGENGFLADCPETFASAVKMLNEIDANRRFGDLARHRMKNEIGTWSDCAKRYREAFQTINQAGHG